MKNIRNVGKRTFQTVEVELRPKGVAQVSDALADKLIAAYPDEISITVDAPNTKTRAQVEDDKKRAKAASDADKQRAAKLEAEAQKKAAAAEAKKKADDEAAAKKAAEDAAAEAAKAK